MYFCNLIELLITENPSLKDIQEIRGDRGELELQEKKTKRHDFTFL